LFVEDDEEVSPAIEFCLQKEGYAVLVVRNEEDALNNLRSEGIPIKLILLNQHMHSDEALLAGRRIRAGAELDPSVPLVVLPFEYEAAMEGTDQSVGDNDYKTYIADTDQLTSLIKRLIPINKQD